MPSLDHNSGSASVPCNRLTKEGFARDVDSVVVEEPLELRIGGAALATLMRTPGDDLELSLGFLLSEGWIGTKRDVGALALCARSRPGARPTPGEGENVADLILPEGAPKPQLGIATRLPATSSCGVCGKRTIEEVLARTPLAVQPAGSGACRRSTPVDWKVPAGTLTRLPDLLRREQPLFQSTGALHAAAIFTKSGELLVAREDIGRHNAVDKVIGWAFLQEALPLTTHILQVSGRTSFEIVQKAYSAGIPCVAGVSGVSSLALELARKAGMTLVGFVRDGSFTVYLHAERIQNDLPTHS